MKRFDYAFGGRRNLLLSAAGLMAVATPLFVGAIGAPSIRAQSQSQNTAASRVYEYDVASIKLSKPSGEMTMVRYMPTPDGFSGTNIMIRDLINIAFGVDPYQISGGPSWIESEKYDVEAKMSDTMMNKLSQMQPDDRWHAQQLMLQELLADRLRLIVHRETKEFPVYSLVVAKNGPKLQASKPAGNSANGGTGHKGGSEPGMMAGIEDGMNKASFWNQPVSYLVHWLSLSLRSPVVDRTGLTGTYDFTLKYVPNLAGLRASPVDAPSAQPAGAVSDSNHPTLLEVIQDQLGLKLVFGKGPLEVVVIDHIERPSRN